MKANIKKWKMTLSVLVLICGVVLLTGCSTLRDWWEYNTPASQVSDEVFSDSHLDNFLSSVRPINGTAESDYRLARYFQKRGKHKFALDELLKAISKDPSYVKAYNALGVSYDSLGKFDLAAKSYKFALKLNPNLDYVYNNLGYSYLLRGNFDAAIDAFKKAIVLNDTHKRYHNNLGLAYARKGQTHMALSEFNLAKNDSDDKTKKVQRFKDQIPSSAPKAVAVETLPEGITPYDDIPKGTGEPLLLAGTAMIVSEGNPEFRLIPDDFTGVDLPEKTIINEVKSSNLPQKNAAEAKDSVNYTVQVSASENLGDATLLMGKLAKKGYPCPYLNKVGNENPFYRVRLGRFIDKESADRWLSDLMTHTLGNKPFITFEDENAKKIILSGKQDCFNEKVVALPVIRIVDIEISNGNGVRHMARNVGIYLIPEGFRATRLTNADNFNYPETKIYYRKGFRQDALRLAKDIPGRQQEANIIELNQLNKRAIKVLIGKDLIPFHAEIKGKLKSHVAKGENAVSVKQMKASYDK
jgi:tetratricopeptide (TPR) repeat protein